MIDVCSLFALFLQHAWAFHVPGQNVVSPIYSVVMVPWCVEVEACSRLLSEGLGIVLPSGSGTQFSDNLCLRMLQQQRISVDWRYYLPLC